MDSMIDNYRYGGTTVDVGMPICKPVDRNVGAKILPAKVPVKKYSIKVYLGGDFCTSYEGTQIHWLNEHRLSFCDGLYGKEVVVNSHGPIIITEL